MSENSTENPPEDTPQAPAEDTPENAAPFAAPADVDDDTATGWAVYDRDLGRYVGPVHRDGKPSKRDAAKLAEGHRHAIVRV